MIMKLQCSSIGAIDEYSIKKKTKIAGKLVGNVRERLFDSVGPGVQ